MSINIFNLFNEYEVSTVDDKIYWVSAEEWSPYEEGYADLVDPEDIFTDYQHGEGVIVDGGFGFDNILVLNKPNKMTGDEEDASSFHAELKTHPNWLETAYVVTSPDRFPCIRYCHRNGNNVSPTEAVIIMSKLGYTWNSVTKRFEKEVEDV